jgi:hypothetical protein
MSVPRTHRAGSKPGGRRFKPALHLDPWSTASDSCEWLWPGLVRWS